jgi:spermidine synthase
MISSRLISLSIIGIGFSSVSIQLLTVKEFLSSFQGNEIVISIILFSWLMLTGAGSFIAKFITSPSYPVFALLNFIIGILPLVQTLFIRMSRDYIFIQGVAVGFYGILGFVLGTIALYCLLTGFILPYALIHLRLSEDRFTSGHLYLMDSLGDILAGICFSFIWVYLLTPFQIIAVTSSLCMAVTVLLLWKSGHKFWVMPVSILSGFFLIICLNHGVELGSLHTQYTSPIVDYEESKYGRIVVTQDQDQYNFFESGTPLFSNLMTTENEETAHYPLSQVQKVNNVLLISGGIGGTLKEIEKHNPKRIDYVELDPTLIKMAKKFHFLAESSRVTLHLTDGRKFISSTSITYDAIILDLPEPDTFQMNRFYTYDFYQQARKVMSPGAVLAFNMSYSPNYLSEVQLQKLSSIYRTVKPFFRNVLLLPGEKAYFLCSDAPLSTEISKLLAQKSITTDYISGYYEGNVTIERIERLNRLVQSHGGRVNKDFSPVVLKAMFTQWFAEHQTSPWYFIGSMAAIFLIYLFSIKKPELVLFTTGFAAMSMELIIMFCFQIMYGYIYLKIGAIVTSFLAGLAPGALIGTRIKVSTRRLLILSEIFLITLIAVYALVVHFIGKPLPEWSFLVYGFIFAFFCGLQFPIIAGFIGEKASPAAGCFAADLAGAALGTIFTGLVLVPLSGIFAAIYFLFFLKVLSLLINVFATKRHLV